MLPTPANRTSPRSRSMRATASAAPRVLRSAAWAARMISAGPSGAVLAEDPDGLPGGLRGLEAVPQPVRPRAQRSGPRRSSIAQAIAADLLPGQGEAHDPELQAASVRALGRAASPRAGPASPSPISGEE